MIQILRAMRCQTLTGTATLALLVLASTAFAQDDQPGVLDPEETTVTGTVASSSRSTLTVRTGAGRYQLFTFTRDATRPATLSVGSRVRVRSTPGPEPGVRRASSVTVLSAAAAQQEKIIGGADEVVPETVRRLEREIERQVRRYGAGVRAGFGLDPEVVLVGAHAQFATGFSRNVVFRPNVEFGWGEVTTMFALNLDAIYRLPVSPTGGRWAAYAGLGPGFTFLHQDFNRRDGDRDIDFGDFDSDVNLNIIGGVEFRSGWFTELRTSVYADPAPTLKLILGYNF